MAPRTTLEGEIIRAKSVFETSAAGSATAAPAQDDGSSDGSVRPGERVVTDDEFRGLLDPELLPGAIGAGRLSPDSAARAQRLMAAASKDAAPLALAKKKRDLSVGVAKKHADDEKLREMCVRPPSAGTIVTRLVYLGRQAVPPGSRRLLSPRLRHTNTLDALLCRFNTLDVDGGGTLDPREVKKMAKLMGDAMKPEALRWVQRACAAAKRVHI